MEAQILKLLREDSLIEPETMARMLNTSPEIIREKMRSLRASREILAYKAVIDDAKLDPNTVKAVIEVRITPEREGGFNNIARRISQFEEVTSCHLMSGGFDLLVFIEGKSLKEVALFVSGKLATQAGVLSTATLFELKAYKTHGVLLDTTENVERLKVSP
ncbi:MAG: Lrp/AsnC family transcriptional regulator [Verrucomicrobiota bacterium]|nr:Lrp/AsnC family transcriptional regulator [Verrucomicrobiota bacterium]